MFLIMTMNTFFGSSFTAAKLCLAHAPPLFAVGCRMVLATAVGVVMLAWGGRVSWRRGLSKLHLLVPLGFLNIYLTNALEYWGLQYLTAAKTGFLYSLCPFITALVSYLLFGERLNGRKWIGLLIGFVGFLPVLMVSDDIEFAASSFSLGFVSLPELAILGSAVASVLGAALIKLCLQRGMISVEINTWSCVVGAAMAFLHSGLIDPWNPIPLWGDVRSFTLALVWMTLAANVVGANLYGYLLGRYSMTWLSFTGFSIPFFTAIFGVWILGEYPSTAFYVSAAVVFIGLLIFYNEELQRPRHQDTSPSSNLKAPDQLP